MAVDGDMPAPPPEITPTAPRYGLDPGYSGAYTVAPRVSEDAVLIAKLTTQLTAMTGFRDVERNRRHVIEDQMIAMRKQAAQDQRTIGRLWIGLIVVLGAIPIIVVGLVFALPRFGPHPGPPPGSPPPPTQTFPAPPSDNPPHGHPYLVRWS
jgi:hypothetical protein